MQRTFDSDVLREITVFKSKPLKIAMDVPSGKLVFANDLRELYPKAKENSEY